MSTAAQWENNQPALSVRKMRKTLAFCLRSHCAVEPKRIMRYAETEADNRQWTVDNAPWTLDNGQWSSCRAQMLAWTCPSHEMDANILNLFHSESNRGLSLTALTVILAALHLLPLTRLGRTSNADPKQRLK
ncbi:hypothetical protein AWZ03_002669 [Drosophila navojoa]|uniref:Uncharacterized protein n=1 Tax=Drosophila navojoa TaxID=7232 RepID=A0A484BQR9_DRONA|nr:hypothetical protein AWZ03_002669 [Drosophila navojoa]